MDYWFYQTYNEINDATAPEEDTATDSVVGLAMQASEEPVTQKPNMSGYGYGALALGAAAAVAYLYKKRQDEKRAHLLGDSQVDLYEGFISVV